MQLYSYLKKGEGIRKTEKKITLNQKGHQRRRVCPKEKNLSGNERRKGKKNKRKHSLVCLFFIFFIKKKTKQNQDIMLCLSFLKENYFFFPFERKKQN